MAELVGLNAHAPDVMGTLGQLLNLKHQQAVVQQEQQSARQRANIAAYDWNKHLGEDGVLDASSFARDPAAPVIFGDQYVDYLTHAAQAQQQGLAAKQSLVNTNGLYRKEFASIVGALRSDPDVAADNEQGRQKLNAELIKFGQQYGKDVLPVLSAYGEQLKHVPQGELPNALKAIQLQAASAESQAQLQNPQFTNTGGSLKNVNNLAAPTGDIPLSLPPGAQVEQHVDQLGNPYLTYRDSRGNIVGMQAVGGDGGPARFAPGERHTFEAQAQTNFENVDANRKAAGMAPQQLDQINKALDLSKDVSTGAWAGKKATVESGIGSLIPGFEGFDNASKLQELDKFAERIATDASRVLGVNARTDAERESIHKQNANIGYTPQAIQSVLKYAKAQTLAMQAKGDAQEAWLAKDGNKITNQHQFETQFRQAYDPRIFQYEVMSPAEQEKFRKSLSKEDRKEIATKSRKLVEMGAIKDGEVD